MRTVSATLVPVSDHRAPQFIALSYHYVFRPGERRHRIYGTPWPAFTDQVETLCREYVPVSLDQVASLVGGQSMGFPQKGILFTFDDGLREHADAVAPYLKSKGIPGVFFIPSAPYLEEIPPNPQILHHALAKHGLAPVLTVRASRGLSCSRTPGEE